MKAQVILFQLLGVTICFSCALAQSQFQRTIGGTADDAGLSIIRTSSGGYAIAGYTRSYSAGYDDIYIAKLDEFGSVQWTKTVGGPSVDEDIGWSIIQTSDGGFAVTGIVGSYGAGGEDMYVVKLDSSGAIQWNKTIGGTNYDYARSIIQTSDGGYAVAGFTSSFGAGGNDMFILKLDASGNLQWCETIGGSGNDYAFSIIQTTDGGYAIAGASTSGTNENASIVKLDANGSFQWNRTVGGTSNDEAYSIVQAADGGYVAAGTTLSYGAGIIDVYIIKLNASGILQWTRAIGGTSYDAAYSIVRTSDGGYATAGFTQSFGAGLYDVYIVKIDSNGALQWTKTVGGTNYDYGYSIVQTTDGGYAVGGITRSFGAGNYDVYIVKLEANGGTCGNSSNPVSFFGTGTANGSSIPTVALQTPTVTSPSPTISSGGVVMSICFVGIQPITNEIPSEFKLYQNYPNPFNPATKIKLDIPARIWDKGASPLALKVFDMLGREVTTLVNEQLKPGTYEVEWNAANFPSGVYFYRIEVGDFIDSKKMVLVK